jgi:hypothetical protein
MAAENSAETRRRLVGRPFPKGVSANPGGRPKGLALRAREATKDGETIIEFMLRVFNGEEPGCNTKLRMEAAGWFSDRGWGKPVQTLEHEAHSGAPTLLVPAPPVERPRIGNGT